jgi:hypothetical protein
LFWNLILRQWKSKLLQTWEVLTYSSFGLAGNAEKFCVVISRPDRNKVGYRVAVLLGAF